jgi:hypothetical protein
MIRHAASEPPNRIRRNGPEGWAAQRCFFGFDPTSTEVMISLADQILRPIFQLTDEKSFNERLFRARTLADKGRALTPWHDNAPLPPAGPGRRFCWQESLWRGCIGTFGAEGVCWSHTLRMSSTYAQ